MTRRIMADDIVERLNSGEGIGACLSGNSRFAAKAMKDGAAAIGRLRAVILNIQALAEKGSPIDSAKLAKRCRKALDGQSTIKDER